MLSNGSMYEPFNCLDDVTDYEPRLVGRGEGAGTGTSEGKDRVWLMQRPGA